LRADAVRVSKLEDVAALFAPNRDLELLIDTASREEIIVALRAGGRQIARKRILAPRHQAEKLLPLIDKILKENDFVPADLKRLVVANRGGSFTSLRIGVITANALAYALKVPVVAADGSAASQRQFSSYHLIEPDYEREPNIGISKKKPLA
jgi:tRNA threonylcarbamoyladenosine biosynthesis protein TsaB